MTSAFSKRFQTGANRLAMQFAEQGVCYFELDTEAKTELCHVQIGDRIKKQRRVDGELEYYYVLHIKIYTDDSQPRFSGIANPKKGARVEITDDDATENYYLSSDATGRTGMKELELEYRGRVALGSRETLGE